jgi:hypothetical protein
MDLMKKIITTMKPLNQNRMETILGALIIAAPLWCIFFYYNKSE